MNCKIIIIVLVSIVPVCVQAQEAINSNDQGWVINEVYISDAPKRYGLFVEFYNPAKPKKFPNNFFLSTSRDHSDQFRLRAKYNPDQRQRGYQSFKVSTVRFKRRTIKLYGRPDTLYLFKQVDYELHVQDSFPVLWKVPMPAVSLSG